jgi:voltage-gated potassium channel
MEIRHRIHKIFYVPTPGDQLRKNIEITISILIIMSIIAIVLESESGLHQAYGNAFYYFEILTVTFFTLEYLLRIWSAPPAIPCMPSFKYRLRYIFSFNGAIDLLAIAPFFISLLYPVADLRFIRLLRMLRLLKLSHYNTAIEDLFSAIYDERKSFLSALYLMSIAIMITSCAMYYAEGVVQPDLFSSIPATLWWTIITITTVGYGDAYPITPIGKMIGGATAVLGVFTTALLTGIVANSFANQMARKRAIFEAELRKALTDGMISEEEEYVLEQLRLTFNLTKEHAQAIKSKTIEELRAKSDLSV